MIINRKKKQEGGFALPELMVAITIILLVLVVTAYVIIAGLKTQLTNENRDKGVQTVRSIIETARAIKFNELVLGNADQGYRDQTPDGETTVTKVGTSVIKPYSVVSSGGIDYQVQTDITWYESDGTVNPVGSTPVCFTSKRVRVEAQWKEDDVIKNTSMSWVRTPTVADCTPTPIPIIPNSVNLPKPTNFVDNGTNTTVRVLWDYDNTGLSIPQLNFRVDKSTESTGPWVELITLAGTQRAYNASTGVSETAYYRVCAVYEQNEACSTPTSMTTVVLMPDVPAVSASKVSDTQARFVFSPAANATSYTYSTQINGGAWTSAVAGSPGAAILINTTAGNTVGIRATAINTSGSSGYGTASVSLATAPVITTNPVARTTAIGSTAAFSAAASGVPTPTVQWQLSTNSGSSWGNISGATSTSYTTGAVTAAMNNYQYRAVFTNSVASATTSGAKLTASVNTPTGLSVLRVVGLKMTLTWNASSNATSYIVNANGVDYSVSGTSTTITMYTGVYATSNIRAVNGSIVSATSGNVYEQMPASGTGPKAFSMMPYGLFNTPNQSALVSPSGTYAAVWQNDGNFVVYRLSDNAVLHGSTRTTGMSPTQLNFQGDGNLVMYRSGTVLVNTGTSGSSPVLQMQDDGNLVLYIGGAARWALFDFPNSGSGITFMG